MLERKDEIKHQDLAYPLHHMRTQWKDSHMNEQTPINRICWHLDLGPPSVKNYEKGFSCFSATQSVVFHYSTQWFKTKTNITDILSKTGQEKLKYKLLTFLSKRDTEIDSTGIKIVGSNMHSYLYKLFQRTEKECSFSESKIILITNPEKDMAKMANPFYDRRNKISKLPIHQKDQMRTRWRRSRWTWSTSVSTDSSGIHLRHSSVCRAPAESRQQDLTSRKEQIEPRKTQ